MAKTYRSYCPDQLLLLPPSLRDWLPENHLAYFVGDVIDQLDLSEIESYYEREDRGQPPYHPRMMTKILVYAYCVGIFSSRKIRTFARFRTSARFITRHWKGFSSKCSSWRWQLVP
jgi:transposase